MNGGIQDIAAVSLGAKGNALDRVNFRLNKVKSDLDVLMRDIRVDSYKKKNR